jgi:hypothetical protein
MERTAILSITNTEQPELHDRFNIGIHEVDLLMDISKLRSKIERILLQQAYSFSIPAKENLNG